ELMSPNCCETSSSKTTSTGSGNISSSTLSSSPSTILYPLAQANHHITCVIIDDSQIGKSSLVVSYTTNDFPSTYIPTAFDNYSVDISVGNRLVHFDTCDTGGKEPFSSLHDLCIPYSAIILLCFSVVQPQSFQNAITYWLSRARRSNSKTSVILVGTQSDLVHDLKTLLKLDQLKQKPITEKEARGRAQQMDATTYMECSALTQKNLKTIFDTAVLAAIDYHNSNSEDFRFQKLKLKNL
ncbi:unnamed protein product, partial [Didymodactylos carnosus]